MRIENRIDVGTSVVNGDFDIETKEAKDSSVMEVHRKLAHENGEIYNKIIDYYLGGQDDVDALNRLIDSVGPQLKKVYQNGFIKFQEELSKNQELLRAHRGHEAEFLLKNVMEVVGIDKAKIDSIIQDIDKAHFVEISSGVPILQLEKDFFAKFCIDVYGIPPQGDAVCFNSDDPKDASFLVTQRKTLERRFSEDISLIKKHPFARHEFHHFIWNFLKRREDFLRKPQERNLAFNEAFEKFRDEISAYIISNGDASIAEPEILVYSKDKEILDVARDAKDFTTLCIQVGGALGVESQDFIYAAMVSRNFNELKSRFLELVTLDKKSLDKKQLEAIYSIWPKNYRINRQLAELLRKKDIEISTEVFKEFCDKQLIDKKIKNIKDFFAELSKLQKFGEAIGVSLNTDEITAEILRARLLLPKETIDLILELPRDEILAIPLDRVAEEVLPFLVSFWSIRETKRQETCSKIINSSPVLREAFSKVKTNIIQKGEKYYRLEMKAGHKTDNQIKEIKEIIINL